MRPTVMIVDDEAPLLRAMQRVLARNFDVIPAAGTEAALTAFADSVNIVLTDFSMPDGDGLQLARALRNRGFHGPVVVLSAVVECEDLQLALASGLITELICKPWSSSALVARVGVLCTAAAGVSPDRAGAVGPA